MKKKAKIQPCLCFFLLFYSFYCNAEILVEDFLGRQVKLSAPAKRVIALAPHIVENVFAAGGGSSLIGVSEHSDYPETAKKITRIGNSQTVNLESILALKPDLVITWHSGRAIDLLQKLEQLGLTVYASNPKTLLDIPKALRDYAQLTGHPDIGARRATAFESRLKSLGAEFSSRKAVSVFYQVWAQPLQTLNGQHLVSDVLRLCGGRNVFEGAPAIAPKVSVESVIAVKPEVILGTWEPGSGLGKPLTIWKKWYVIPAVVNGKLYTVPPDLMHRHSPRILDGAERVCQHLEAARKTP